MRIARLLGLVLAVLTAGVLLAPTAAGQPPFRLPSYVNAGANALSGSEFTDVQQAVDKLYNDRHIRLWVVYADTFSGQDAVSWTEQTRRLSDIGGQDALLAGATHERNTGPQLGVSPPPQRAGPFRGHRPVDNQNRTQAAPELRARGRDRRRHWA